MNGHLELGDLKPTPYFFSIAIVLGLLFAMISAESDGSMWFAFIRWQLQTVMPMALLIAAHRTLLTVRSFSQLRPYVALLISGLLGASLFCPIALLIDQYLEPVASESSVLWNLFDEWISITPPIAISWIAINLPWVLGYRLEKIQGPDQNEKVAEPKDKVLIESTFMALIPAEKQGSLLYLKSELHYLQVVTQSGSSLILFNLGDAVSQLSSESGLLVHRSYWVAFEAVESLVRKGRQGELKLVNGEVIPVSRSNFQKVDSAIKALI